MPKKSIKEIQDVMRRALLELRDLGEGTDQADFLQQISLFLLSVVSTAADLVEVKTPGGGAYLYGEVEAGTKAGGIRAIAKAMLNGSPHYSVSNIDEKDGPTAMNYIGQKLNVALTKAIHELPKPLRTLEMQLRGIEALLANILNQKFDYPHDVLDQLCQHVHMALHDLQDETRTIH